MDLPFSLSSYFCLLISMFSNLMTSLSPGSSWELQRRSTAFMRAKSSFMSKGLTIKSSAPSSRHTTLSTTSPLAVIMIIGFDENLRISVQTSLPLFPGSIMSRSMISGSYFLNVSMASYPSAAVLTSYPSFSRLCLSKSRMLLSSSTTRIFV